MGGHGRLCAAADSAKRSPDPTLKASWTPRGHNAPQPRNTAIANHLIALLPRADQKRLLALCEPLPLVLSTVLQEAGALTRHAWFPDTAFISLLVRTPDHSSALEVGLVGREGMLGTQLALGVREAPLTALVQGAGLAWRIGRVALGQELNHSAALRSVLLRYVQVQLLQLATTATCLRFHAIQQRLARWLLMTQDRAASSDFAITHEFLSTMLGVRRVGITQAAQALQRQGLIHYHRGELEVLDRAGLLLAACPCYAADSASFTRLLRAQPGATTEPPVP
jgi:CRP-like cAMP-binding protein